MPEAIGKLDGLRDIIHPPAPVLTDYTIELAVLIFVIVAGLVYFLYKRYQDRRIIRAKKYFQLLKHRSSEWNDKQCGDAIMTILRLYSGVHNVKMQNFPEFEASEWSALINHCNRLRFSSKPLSKEILARLMSQIETMLWSRR